MFKRVQEGGICNLGFSWIPVSKVGIYRLVTRIPFIKKQRISLEITFTKNPKSIKFLIQKIMQNWWDE